MSSPQWILASNSPRRRELIRLLGLAFTPIPANIDESVLPNEEPLIYVRRLADSKAEAIHTQYPGANVLAADTIVVDGGQILGKPASPAEAIDILRQLRSHAHRVHTALTFITAPEGVHDQELCSSLVPMRAYTDDEIDAYVATGDPLDKAGAYAIQHGGFHPVEAFYGCYASVMGLPLCHLARMIARSGSHVKASIARDCQNALQYDCPIHQQVLAGKEIG